MAGAAPEMDLSQLPAESPAAGNQTDVLVVGVGVGARPVGLVSALLLGRRSWRVTVLERWPSRSVMKQDPVEVPVMNNVRQVEAAEGFATAEATAR